MKTSLACAVALVAWCASAQDLQQDVLASAAVRAPAPPLGWNRAVAAPALEFAKRTGLTLYVDHDRFIGNDRGWAASAVGLRAGGFVVTGALAGKPLVVKLDGGGRELWRRELSEQGFAVFEAASVLELSDGSVVAVVLAYRTPSSAANARFTRLRADGKVLWTRALRYQWFDGSPFPLVVKRGKDDAVLIRGHVGVGNEQYVWWEGRIDATGRITHDTQLEPMESAFRTFHYDRMEPTSVQ
jgi:hypothetical protein